MNVSNLNYKVLFAAIQVLKKRDKDAIFYLNRVFNQIEIKNTNCFFTLFLAFLYQKQGESQLFFKFFETAKRFKMRELGMLPNAVVKSKYLNRNNKKTRQKTKNDR